MKKILLPLEETERSLKALHYTRKHYASEEAELVLMMVDESLGFSVKSDAESAALKELDEKLDVMAAMLEDYKLTKVTAAGKAGIRITRTARELGADLIIMTKSSKEDMLSSIGSTAEYVINNAPCDVVIVSEAVNSRSEYRGLVYRTAKGVVTLRGQLGDKQSECLLPSINQDCLYHIDVTVGRVRFFHTSYNPDTRNWDQPPLPGQDVTLDIAAGESKYILVKADSTEGKADRIRIVNRDMKKEAVFSFRITAAEYDENGEPIIPEPQTAAPAAAQAGSVSRSTIEMLKVPDYVAGEAEPAEAEAEAAAEAPAEPTVKEIKIEAVPVAEEVKAEAEPTPVDAPEIKIEGMPVVEEIKSEEPKAAEAPAQEAIFSVEIHE